MVPNMYKWNDLKCFSIVPHPNETRACASLTLCPLFLDDSYMHQIISESLVSREVIGISAQERLFDTLALVSMSLTTFELVNLSPFTAYFKAIAHLLLLHCKEESAVF
jgi:hypothetical protein